ncbi:ANL_HP_G0008450.mRNA.1.CDS.1 [Saccharomyces cerevisiae]|nr:ANL_HP_G0026570.mRNA.1.CDS.1 [Saccharomyces cerevisiae]CAI5042115.1 ANL_HP_G0086360.mRNA.1.CDS.1 [Saccharomyces cerevisiae]CAI5096270.1 ANL_HP_G0103950.mRNA.1.CDS.1 [Saccharomyces cerevisiae]CAI5217855.1 ANL_HP_G0008450.mRNA.1.CDS.1 [Saccharomyces cerevisiae]CAI6684952.1 ANL_HP_G0026570.mRNA.1.CDS.1 [Saccharomyces cerevisiae]
MNSTISTNSTTTATSTNTSTQQVVTSLVSNGTIFGVFVIAFLILRIKLKRIYEPKSSFNLINEERKPEPLPQGVWQWLKPLLKKSDNFDIQQAGLDGYFFLRYLFIIAIYCAVSMSYIFPILLSINASNGNHESGLNQLAYQNVKHRGRYFAHVFCGWIFFWGFLYIIYRELYFYTSMKQAVLASPRYAKKLSSRTVLFQTVPKQYLSEEEFSKLFDGVKRVWIARGSGSIEAMVKARDNMAIQLEGAETKYLKAALKKIKKLNKKSPQLSVSDNIAEYVPDKKRPHHKINKVAKFFFGKKVDTISYIKEELPKLNQKVKALQEDHENSSPFNSVFVEFESQYQAQVAAQITTYHAPLFMTPAYIGIEPSDVVWFNLRMFWWERLGREVSAVSAIVALVILWAFPVAFVGMISNITSLTNEVKWLKFIYKLPKQLLGLLTSLAPTVALAVLMSFLPKFIRGMAITQGAPSKQNVEYFTQQAYFAFQVIQVFLVTTLSSAATSTVTEIVKEPTKAMDLLASNLPKASNFFMSYVILQGLSISSGALLQIVPLILFYVLGAFLDGTVRKKWNRFCGLSSMQWGTAFPVYTNLAVITFSYSIISPLILLFAAVAFFLLYIAYLYNLTYVYQESPDARGIYYPRALFQTIVGIYIGQICLLGLFAVGKGWGPIVLQVIGICVTVLIHLHLSAAFDHLSKVIPVDTMKPLDGVSDTPSFKNIYKGIESTKVKKNTFGANIDMDGIKELPEFPIKKYHKRSESVTEQQVENSIFSENTFEYQFNPANEANADGHAINAENLIEDVPLLADGDTMKIPPAPWWKRFLKPHIYYSYKAVKSRLPEIYGLVDPDERVNDFDISHAYDYPAVSAQCPELWIPRDPFGFSKLLISDVSGVVEMNDENATIDENLKFTLHDVPPPYNDVKDEANGEANGEFDTASKENNPFADPKYKEEESRSAV